MTSYRNTLKHKIISKAIATYGRGSKEHHKAIEEAAMMVRRERSLAAREIDRNIVKVY